MPHGTPTEKQAWNVSRELLVKTLSDMVVTCRSGRQRPLRDTTLPRRRILKTSQSSWFEFLDVPDPDDINWDFLHILGVRTQFGLEFLHSKVGNFIERLEELSEEEDPALEEIEEQYRQIDTHGSNELVHQSTCTLAHARADDVVSRHVLTPSL